MATPTGNELVAVIGVSATGGQAAVAEYFTTQEIADLGGGGGGGGTETGTVVSIGGTVNVTSVTAGQPTNIIVTTTDPVTVNIPAPDSGAPWGRVNISGASSSPNITVTPVSGLINGAASVAISVPYESESFLDFGTGWMIQ